MLIKVTNILALSSLRQLLAHRQMHHVKLLIDKRFSRTKKPGWQDCFRFYSSKEANVVGGRAVMEASPPMEEEVEHNSTYIHICGVHNILSETRTTIG